MAEAAPRPSSGAAGSRLGGGGGGAAGWSPPFAVARPGPPPRGAPSARTRVSTAGLRELHRTRLRPPQPGRAPHNSGASHLEETRPAGPDGGGAGAGTGGDSGPPTPAVDVECGGAGAAVRALLSGAEVDAAVREIDAQRLQFASAVLQYDVAYREALAATAHLPTRNALRTATSCVLLDRLLSALQPRHPRGICSAPVPPASSPPLLHRLKADVFAAIYCGATHADFAAPLGAGEAGAALLMRLRPFYAEHADVLAEHRRVLAEFAAKNSTSEKQQLVLERVIDRWQAMLVDRMFCAWRNHVKRNRSHEKALVRLVKRRARREYLSWSFFSWRYTTKCASTRSLRRAVEHVSDLRAKDHHRFKEETAELLRTIEALREERVQLANQARKALDEAAAGRVAAEQLQLRLEQQRATAQSWKEAAISLMRANSPQSATPPETLLLGPHRHGSDGPLLPVGARASQALGHVPVSETPADRLVLMWVTRVVEMEEAASGAVAGDGGSGGIAPVGRVHDFDGCFQSARILAYVAAHAGQLPRAELHGLLLKSATAIATVVLPKLEAFAGSSLGLRPLDVTAGNPALMFVLMSLVLERHQIHVVRPGALERAFIATSLDTKANETVTLGDVKAGALAAAQQQHDWRVLVDTCRQHAAQLLRQSTSAVDQVAADSVVDRALIRRILEERNGVSCDDAAGAAIVTEVADQLSLLASPLRETFGMYSTTKAGMTHSKFTRFLSDTKLITRTFPKKGAAKLFEYLLRTAASTCDSSGATSGGAETIEHFSNSLSLTFHSESQLPVHGAASAAMCDSPTRAPPSRTSLSLPQWVAAIVHIAFLRDDLNALTPARKVSGTVAHVQSLAKTSGLDEFREACYARPVQDVIAKNVALLTRIFETAAGADDDPEMSFDEFLTVIKDAKLLDHNLSLDACKSLFEFTQDAPLPQASMVFRDFIEALVALAVFKIPAPWIPLADRVKAFLRDHFLPPFTKKMKQNSRKR